MTISRSALHGDRECRRHEHERDGGRRQRFRLAVPERIVGVRVAAAMRRPPHTMVDEKRSAVDSMPSAISAYELPNTPATIFIPVRLALTSSPT